MNKVSIGRASASYKQAVEGDSGPGGKAESRGEDE